MTAVNEAARLEAEELGSFPAAFTVLPWESDRADALPTGAAVGTDAPLAGRRDVSEPLEAARRALTSAEVERYRRLGGDAAAALTETCFALSPRDSERSAAARLASALLARGADPVVLLVAGGERLRLHRHPLPTAAELGRLAMLVACARRDGLVASLTRLVAFGRLPAELRAAHARLLHVDTAFNLATLPGRRVGAAFSAGRAAYPEQGFDPEEWRLHHQGGPTGYEARDYLATASSVPVIEEGQAFAWNPSVPGLKAEDTVLAWPAAPEVLTVDPSWPTASIAGMERPLILER